MVLTILIPARQLFGLKDLITTRHLENMCKVILLTGCIVGYAYSMEFFTAWYSGNPFESFVFINRAHGAVRVGVLDHGDVQCDYAATLLVQEGAHQPVDHLRAGDLREHRHVVRAVS